MKKNFIVLFFLLLVTCSLDILAQRRQPTSIHTTGARLFETSSYELYEYGMMSGRWCENSRAAVSLVLKVDADYVITDDDAYKRRFERELFPVIKQRCESVTGVSVYNYIKGVRIARDLKEYREDDQSFPGSERQLGTIRVDIDRQGGFHYQNLSSITSLADLRKRREAEAARDARQTAAAQAAERERKEAEKVEQQREAENDKIESKGGLEPTSKELAVAFTRFIKMGTPTCPNLENMEFCEWASRVAVRLKGGEKKTCKPVVVGMDYVCEYTVEFECLLKNPRTGDYEKDSPARALYCTQWMTRTLETGVRRIPNGWIAYPLDKNRGKGTPGVSRGDNADTTSEDNLHASSASTPCPKNSSTEKVFTLNDRANTGMAIKRGDRITISASGVVTFGAFAGRGGPQGISFNPLYNYIPNFPHGSLIGRVKRSSGDDQWTYIGTGITVISQVDGILQLAVNDKDPQNNSGEFRVEVTVCAAR